MEVFPILFFPQILQMFRRKRLVTTLKIWANVNGLIFREADPNGAAAAVFQISEPEISEKKNKKSLSREFYGMPDTLDVGWIRESA